MKREKSKPSANSRQFTRIKKQFNANPAQRGLRSESEDAKRQRRREKQIGMESGLGGFGELVQRCNEQRD